MFRKIRITILSIILLIVAVNTWLDDLRSADWSQTLRIVIYPINGDESMHTQSYISRLTREDFTTIEDYIEHEARRYGIRNPFPVTIDLAPPLNSHPPAIPQGGGALSAIRWSLALRYWAWKVDNFTGITPQIRLYISYYDPKIHSKLKHSAGLRKGLIGVIQAFASQKMAATNKVIISHEMLHTLGAQDRYDLKTNLPRYPEGYAEPNKQPRWPQKKAEIMAGRIPITPSRAEIPRTLADTLIGPVTAREIHWINTP